MPRMTPVRPVTSLRCRSASLARPGSLRQTGAASLIVVMVLFFLMSLVAAYTSRNLIFEQRTSINQYRATQAYEAAEAGLEWALTMLNSGRIGGDCLETGATAASTSFRQRYLAINADTGMVTPRTGTTSGTPLWPSCVSDGAGGWTCNCPADTAAALGAPGGTGVFPAFRVRFTANDLTRPGLIRIESNGCTKPDPACLNHPASAQNLEGRANVAAIVALASALPTPPGAALSVLGNAAAPGSILALYNTDAGLGGITVQAGGIVDHGAWTLRSVPGTSGPVSVVQNETALSALSASPDRAFASVFSMWPATYRSQQAAVVVPCPAADCREALANAVAMNPDRVVWATPANPTDTHITLASAGIIGSAPGAATVAGPAVIVFDRPLNVTASGVRVFGFVYTRGGDWQGSNPVEIQGATFVEGNLAGTARATVAMDSAVLKSLRLRSGSFVRAPGGWDDFRGRAP